MPGGRRPTPTHLRVVKGNPGHRPLNTANEPTPPRVSTPEPPAHLTAIAVECWRNLTPIAVGLGVLTVADMVSWERLCEAYAEVRAAQLRLDMLGDTVYETTSTQGGVMRRPHPEVAQLADADRRLRGYLADFGLSPSARSKVSAPGAAARSDPLEHYFGAG